MRIKKNGKVINLTESDLRRIVKRVLVEQEGDVSFTPFTTEAIVFNVRGTTMGTKNWQEVYYHGFVENEDGKTVYKKKRADITVDVERVQLTGAAKMADKGDKDNYNAVITFKGAPEGDAEWVQNFSCGENAEGVTLSHKLTLHKGSANAPREGYWATGKPINEQYKYDPPKGTNVAISRYLNSLDEGKVFLGAYDQIVNFCIKNPGTR